MFEQAILSPGHETKRVWTTAMGVTTQALVVTGMILAPMIWPEVLPKGQLFVPLVGPRLATAPTPAPAGEVAVRPRDPKSTARVNLPWRPPDFQAPARVPNAIIEAPMEPGGAVFTTGVAGPSGPGSPFGIPGLEGVGRIAAPPPPPPPTTPKAKVEPTQSRPIRVGGEVAAAMLRHRVEPVYPPIARQTRVQGTVELRGIIGANGRIRELKVLSGHPFLAKAALDAISQWIYEPTRLNGQPVEVDAPITVTFRLN